LRALTAHYYPGAEPPEMEITDEDRGPERFNSLVVALAGSGRRLKHLLPVVAESGGRKDAALRFLISP